MLLNGNQEEKSLIERMKQEQNNSDMSFLKGMISTLDKKVDEEIQHRLRSEDDGRKWFESKLNMIVEKSSIEERSSLDRERRMMQQLQEGLTTLSEIVRGVKESTSIGLSDMHALSMESIHELSKKVEIIKDSVNVKTSAND